MAKGSGGSQIAMVINLDKCIGCHTCTVACKNLWTNKDGREFMYWNNVESRPGEGYPRNWESKGGGFQGGQPDPGTFPTNSEYGLGPQGEIVDYDYQAGLGIPLRVKVYAFVMVVVAFSVSVAVAVKPLEWRLVMVAIGAAIITYIATRPTRGRVVDSSSVVAVE